MKIILNKVACCIFLFIANLTMYTTAQCASLPKWYLNPQRDHADSLIGVGEGTNPDSAAKAALNDIASRLSVTVSSAWEKSESQSRNSDAVLYQQDIKSQIRTNVAQVRFNNYEILENEQIEGKLYVLVEVDKRKFLIDKKQELTNLNYLMEKTYASLQDKQILQQIVDLKTVTEKVVVAMPLVSMIVSLDPTFDGAPFFDKYNSYLVKEKELLSQARVALSYSDGSGNFAGIIREHLNNNNFTVLSNNAETDRHTFHVNVNSEIKRLRIYGSNNVKVLTRVELKDTTGHVVASSRIESKGSSMIGYDEAEKAAAFDLDSKIKKTGLFQALGVYRTPQQLL